MNEIERRTLIGAAGLGALAAIGKAGGPLNPPGGTVTGTGRTLDEVYNKIPAVGASDGRTPIPGGATAVNIFSPGSYVLTGDITAAATALNIFSSNVKVDLNGFRITCTSTAAAAVTTSNSISNVSVRNGTITGGAYGVYAGPCNALLLEDLQIIAPRLIGVFSPFSSVGCTVRRCTFLDTGSTSLAGDTSNIVAGVFISGNGARIQECTILRTTHNGTPPVTIRGVMLGGAGCVVEGCIIVNDAVQATSTGVNVPSNTVYRWNNVQNMTIKYNGGTDGGGNI